MDRIIEVSKQYMAGQLSAKQYHSSLVALIAMERKDQLQFLDHLAGVLVTGTDIVAGGRKR